VENDRPQRLHEVADEGLPSSLSAVSLDEVLTGISPLVSKDDDCWILGSRVFKRSAGRSKTAQYISAAVSSTAYLMSGTSYRREVVVKVCSRVFVPSFVDGGCRWPGTSVACGWV
jgi:hypothetical protein